MSVSIIVFDKLFKIIKYKADKAKDTVKNYKYYKLAGFIILILFVLVIYFFSMHTSRFIDSLLPKLNLGKWVNESIMFGLFLSIFSNLLKHKKINIQIKPKS